MKKNLRIKLGKQGKFDHNVYISCEKIEYVLESEIMVDGVMIDFIIEIISIEENI